MSDPEIEQAEKTFIVSLLTNKAIMAALVALILAAIYYGTGWLTSRSDAEPKGALSSDPCYVSKPTNATQQACIGVMCAALAFSGVSCHAQPAPPSPAPIVVVDAGPSVVQFPKCKQGLMAPHYDANQINQWKRTLTKPYSPRPQGQLFQAPTSTDVNSVGWDSNLVKPLNQTVGSCTCCGTAQILSTKPFAGALTLFDAEGKLYPLATKIDGFPGAYPPNDTGSTGAFACKAAVQLGYATACLPTFYTLAEAERTLLKQPIGWGINWHAKSYVPNSCGDLDIGGPVDGGHFTALTRLEIVRTSTGMVDTAKSKIWGWNSWGNDWGACMPDGVCGFYAVTLDNAKKLLDEGGEFDAPKLQ